VEKRTTQDMKQHLVIWITHSIELLSL